MVRVTRSEPKLGLLPVPPRSPPGAVGYLVWGQAFSLQRPRGALLAAEKTHWEACQALLDHYPKLLS